MRSIVINQPDDWHLHLRDGKQLAMTVPASARVFARAIVMPNLANPIITVSEAECYRARILEQVPAGRHFDPLMTLYLQDAMSTDEITKADAHPCIYGCKLYPAGATTHSTRGVNNIEFIYPLLEKMANYEMPLLIHGEVTDPDIDIFDREAVFIDRYLLPICERFPQLPIVFEHITTKTAVDFVSQAPSNVAATITAHHLLYNRNTLLAGGIRPHYYCLPILKTEEDRQALLAAATSGVPKFFLGTDSAPHTTIQKESACGCAGIFSAPCALESYATVFDAHHSLDKLENFASRFGAEFYRLPLNTQKVEIRQQEWQVPTVVAAGEDKFIPMCAGETLTWQAKPILTG